MCFVLNILLLRLRTSCTPFTFPADCKQNHLCYVTAHVSFGLFNRYASCCRCSASEDRPVALVSQEALVAACGEAARHLKPYQVLPGSIVLLQAKV